MNQSSNFIINISNDTWFGSSIGPHHHLEITELDPLRMINGQLELQMTVILHLYLIKGQLFLIWTREM